ncbi:hypothetical protein, partial [Modicisalibacter luteus]
MTEQRLKLWVGIGMASFLTATGQAAWAEEPATGKTASEQHGNVQTQAGGEGGEHHGGEGSESHGGEGG